MMLCLPLSATFFKIFYATFKINFSAKLRPGPTRDRACALPLSGDAVACLLDLDCRSEWASDGDLGAAVESDRPKEPLGAEPKPGVHHLVDLLELVVRLERVAPHLSSFLSVLSATATIHHQCAVVHSLVHICVTILAKNVTLERHFDWHVER